MKFIKILLVDNDDELLMTLSESLNKEGFLVVTCNDSTQAVSIAVREKPNLILLELFMKKMDGIDLCIELSKQKQLQHTMLVFLTSRNQEFEDGYDLSENGSGVVKKFSLPKSTGWLPGCQRKINYLGRIQRISNRIPEYL